MLETFRQAAYVYIHLNDSIERHAMAKYNLVSNNQIIVFWFKKHGFIVILQVLYRLPLTLNHHLNQGIFLALVL